MNPIKVGGRVSVETLLREHVRGVVNRTPTLGHAALVLEKSPRWLLRFRDRNHLGPPQRQPPDPEADGLIWLDD